MAAITEMHGPIVPKPIDTAGLIRLMHLVSPSLPTGGFAYSQGLEMAVESGWIRDDTTLVQWLRAVLSKGMACVDLPLFKRLYNAASASDLAGFTLWAARVAAFRETRELREEEKNRGRAMAAIIKELGILEVSDATQRQTDEWLGVVAGSQLAGFAFACAQWQIPLTDAASGYCWAWLENQVVSAVKIIPLGQTAGQKALMRLAEKIAPAVSIGLSKQDHDIGGSLPALAIGSSRHEIQYTRLYRS